MRATDIDRLRIRLARVGIATFLLISAFDIHRWRRDNWQAFDGLFADAAAGVFGQMPSPLWLYALAAPFVAVNFAVMVQLARGRTRNLLAPLLVSAGGIAIMPLWAWQMVVYRMIWPDILTTLGYAIGGALGVLLWLGLDSQDVGGNAPVSKG